MTEEPVGLDPEDAVLVVEISGRVLVRNRSVLAENRSQTETIGSALGEHTYRIWIRQEAFRRPTPADLEAVNESNTHRVLTGSAV